MTTHHLLHHFAPITEAPNAVARLRQLVLDLAVAGKFGTNHRTETVPDKYQHEPSSENLPPNWRTLRFEKYFDIQGGNQPPKSQFVYEPKPGYVRLFQIRDLGEDPVPTYIPVNSTNRFCKVGEILIGRYGASIGKIFWAQDGAYNVALAKFIFPLEDLEPGYVFFLLKSYFFQSALTGASRSAQAGFNKGDIADVQLPLPPLAEQQRIVAKVDELMTLCDELAAAQSEREARRDRLVAATLHHLTATPADDPAPFPERARFYFNHLPRLTTRPEHIQGLRQTILNLAVQGKLVPQDPHDEPASELLKRIQVEKEQLILRGEIKKQAQTYLEDNESLLPLPISWCWTRLQDVFLVITDGEHQPPPQSEDGIPFLVIGNIRNRTLNFSGCRYVPESYYTGLDPTRRPVKGDILYTLVGSYGIPVLIQDNRQFCIQRHIGILRPSNQANARFLTYVMDSGVVFDQATACATGIAQKTVPLGGLRKILIPLPPLAEQQRIVARVDELLTLCDALAANLDTVTATRRRLLEAALAEALAAA